MTHTPASCLDCDYDLTGNTSYRCPECGRPFNPDDPDSFSPVPRPERERRRRRRVSATVVTSIAGVLAFTMLIIGLLGLAGARALDPNQEFFNLPLLVLGLAYLSTCTLGPLSIVLAVVALVVDPRKWRAGLWLALSLSGLVISIVATYLP